MAKKLPEPPKRPPMQRVALAKLQEIRKMMGGTCVGCKAVKAASEFVNSIARRR